MIDVLAEDLDPVMLSLFPNREARLQEVGVVERAQRDRDQSVELAVDLVMHVGPAFRTEVERGSVAAVGYLHKAFRSTFDRHLLCRPARLHGKGAARTLLAVEAVADGHADGLPGDGGLELAAAARGGAAGHLSAFLSASRTSASSPASG